MPNLHGMTIPQLRELENALLKWINVETNTERRQRLWVELNEVKQACRIRRR